MASKTKPANNNKSIKSFLLFILTAIAGHYIYQQQFPADECDVLVKTFIRHRGTILARPNEQDSKDALTFFLHVPRTAGKGYKSCLLNPASKPSRRCLNSHDVLHYRQSHSNCSMLSSHDDYSIIDMLPASAKIITQLRNPIDRVISTYEFAMELAARGVAAPVLTPMPGNVVDTLNVWPWSYLLPWFHRDLRHKISGLKKMANAKDSPTPPLWIQQTDPTGTKRYWLNTETREQVNHRPPPSADLVLYDNPMVTTLEDWIELPMVQELVHEGTALQLLGITNNSHWAEHTEIRQCFFNHPKSRSKLLKLAEKRLRSMFHVGLTEQFDASVKTLAKAMGFNWSDPWYSAVSRSEYSYDSPVAKAMLDNTITIDVYNEKAATTQPTTLTLREARALQFTTARRRRDYRNTIQALMYKLDGVADEAIKSEMQQELAEFQEADQGLQATMQAIQSHPEMEALMKLQDPVNAPPELIIPESFYEMKETLGEYHPNCVTNSRAKNKKQTLDSFAQLKTPWHKTVRLADEDKQAVKEKLGQRILELNQADEYLWNIATEMLQQYAAGGGREDHVEL